MATKPTIHSQSKSPRIYLGRQAWIQHVADYRQSGKTQPEYCRQHNLVLTTFRNWVTKLKLEGLKKTAAPASKKTTFVPVNITPTQLASLDLTAEPLASELQITLPNGIQCTFPPNHSPRLILPWIDYLRVLP